MTEFKNGDRVKFKAGPRSVSQTVATVTGQVTSGEGKGKATFLTTKDDGGIERKVRPGACAAA